MLPAPGGASGFDQPDLPNVAMVELVGRRLQTIEFQYRERIRQADKSMVFGAGVSPTVAGSVARSPEEADLFDGQERIHSCLCCSPALVRHVTESLKDESMIAKDARKAQEEQMLARQQGRSSQPPPTQGAFEIPSQAPPDHAAAQDPFNKNKDRGRGRGKGGEWGLGHTGAGHLLTAEAACVPLALVVILNFGGAVAFQGSALSSRHQSTWALVCDSTSGRRCYQCLKDRQVCSWMAGCPRWLGVFCRRRCSRLCLMPMTTTPRLLQF